MACLTPPHSPTVAMNATIGRMTSAPTTEGPVDCTPVERDKPPPKPKTKNQKPQAAHEP